MEYTLWHIYCRRNEKKNQKWPNTTYRTLAGLAWPGGISRTGRNEKIRISGITDMSYKAFGIAVADTDGPSVINIHY